MFFSGLIDKLQKQPSKLQGFIVVLGLIKFSEALRNTPSGIELRMSGSGLFHPLIT